jgi:hypothetical protein
LFKFSAIIEISENSVKTNKNISVSIDDCVIKQVIVIIQGVGKRLFLKLEKKSEVKPIFDAWIP